MNHFVPNVLHPLNTYTGDAFGASETWIFHGLSVLVVIPKSGFLA